MAQYMPGDGATKSFSHIIPPDAVVPLLLTPWTTGHLKMSQKTIAVTQKEKHLPAHPEHSSPALASERQRPQQPAPDCSPACLAISAIAGTK